MFHNFLSNVFLNKIWKKLYKTLQIVDKHAKNYEKQSKFVIKGEIIRYNRSQIYLKDLSTYAVYGLD